MTYKSKGNMVLPMPRPTAIEKFTGRRTPASMRPMTESRIEATKKRMAAKERQAARDRQNVMTGSFASDN